MNEGANTSFTFAEGRIANSIPKGHFWPITMQIYMSYQLWLLQARVKTVEAEDLKIKYSPLTVTKKMKITFRMMFCN